MTGQSAPDLRPAKLWMEMLAKIARPVMAAGLGPGLTQAMPVEVAPGVKPKSRIPHNALEALGRLYCGIAPLLEAQAKGERASSIALEDVHRVLENALSAGPMGLNFSEGKQTLVDIAFLAQAVLRAPLALDKKLPMQTRARLIAVLKGSRNIRPHFNNWLLFSAIIEATLCQLGEDWDTMRVDLALRQIDAWYVGDGTYTDGPEFHVDYYNSYVIQPMLLDILSVVGDQFPEWAELSVRATQRAARQCEILERMVGPDGSFPPIGRSLVYRSGAFHLLAQMALRRDLPSALAPEQVREALWAVISRTLGDVENFDSEGWLRIGLNGSQPSMAERYIATGSLYLCTTAFLPLGLSDEDPFWSGAGKPWSQASLWSQKVAVPRDTALKG